MPSGDHIYLSTYCLHGEHDLCRQICKFCEAPCVCSCHDRDDSWTRAAHERAVRGRVVLMPPFER